LPESSRRMEGYGGTREGPIRNDIRTFTLMHRIQQPAIITNREPPVLLLWRERVIDLVLPYQISQCIELPLISSTKKVTLYGPTQNLLLIPPLLGAVPSPLNAFPYCMSRSFPYNHLDFQLSSSSWTGKIGLRMDGSGKKFMSILLGEKVGRLKLEDRRTD
jgi:hypothetical protein